MSRQVERADLLAHGRSLSQVSEAILHDTQHGAVQATSPARPARPTVAEGRTVLEWIASSTT